ncbi:retrovirus-related pol polyprotein from transposon TNT 1-94 [Tanacetum coccineum]
MITQPTDVPSGNNTEVSGSITESLVPDVTQSHILNQASISSHPVPQDRWSRDQYIELVNIIGDPGKGMLTRSMAAKLTAALASECLFDDFFSEIEPKKWRGWRRYGGGDEMKVVVAWEVMVVMVWVVRSGVVVVSVGCVEVAEHYSGDGADRRGDVGVVGVDDGDVGGCCYGRRRGGRGDGDGSEVMMVVVLWWAAVGRQPEERAARAARWVDDMQEELNQFYRNKVWTLVPLPYGKIAIGSKWVFKNKKDEHCITTQNKARLVAQVYNQEEGINYDETFAPYTRNLLKKYEISDSSLVKTPMVPPNNLGLDLVGKLVNETSYRGMIGSLMYLTTTRPDIQFSTVLCARYQSNPNESHQTAVKRIFKYLKGTQTLGLYYPKCLALILKDIQTQTMLVVIWTEKAPQVPVKYLVENWFVGVPRNSNQWLCPQLKLNMLLLLGVVQVSYG